MCWYGAFPLFSWALLLAGARSLVLCSACRSREAFYYRSYSGEALCHRCLLRVLERLSSHSVGDASPTPRSRFLVPVSSFAPSSSLLTARVLWGAERRFPAEVVLGVPSFMLDPVKPALGLLPKELKVLAFEVSPGPPAEADPISCARYDRAWALRAAGLVGADIVVLPMSRTDLTLMSLEALLGGDADGLSESLRVLEVGGIKVVAGLSRAEREAVAAAEYSQGFSDVKPACRVRPISKGVLMSIYGRPEVDYGGLVAPERLVTALSGRARCPVCGGLSPGGVCPRCRSMGLEGLTVRLLGPVGPASGAGPS